MNEEQQPYQPPQLPNEPNQGSASPPLPPSSQPSELEPIAAPPNPDANRPWSVGDILAGIINSPIQTMEYAAEAKPVKLGLGTYFSVLLFTTAISLLTWRHLIDPEEMKLLTQLMGGKSEDFIGLMVGIGQGASLILQPLFFFLGIGVYYLLGDLFGGQKNGKGLIATLGLARLPMILVPPFQLIGIFVLGSDLATAAGLVVSLWIWALQVIAIRSSLQLSWGRAAAVWVLPSVALFIAIFIFVIIMTAFFAPLLQGLN